MPASSRWRRESEGVGGDGDRSVRHGGDLGRQVEVALAGSAHDAGEHLPGVGALAGAIPAAHLADDHGGADGLLGAPVGGVYRRVEQKRNTASNSLARCRAKRSASSSGGAASIRRASRATSRAAGRRQSVLADDGQMDVCVRPNRYSALRQSGKHRRTVSRSGAGALPAQGTSTGADRRQRQRPVGPPPRPYRVRRTLTDGQQLADGGRGFPALWGTPWDAISRNPHNPLYIQ